MYSDYILNQLSFLSIIRLYLLINILSHDLLTNGLHEIHSILLFIDVCDFV